MRPADVPPETFLRMPPSRAEQELMAERESLETALARVRFFVDAEDREWIVRYPAEPLRHARAGAAQRGLDGAGSS